MFLVGALKGNLRVVGAERIVFDLEGNQEVSFEWGQGKATNNQAEVLALYQGIKILNQRGIRELIAVGDSLSDGNLARLTWRIQEEAS